ncbi:hypothetical protein ACVOZ6_003499 [Escherichia coli]
MLNSLDLQTLKINSQAKFIIGIDFASDDDYQYVTAPGNNLFFHPKGKITNGMAVDKTYFSSAPLTETELSYIIDALNVQLKIFASYALQSTEIIAKKELGMLSEDEIKTNKRLALLIVEGLPRGVIRSYEDLSQDLNHFVTR